MSVAASAALSAYLSALAKADYRSAYGALQSQGQRYYRNEPNFESGFRVEHFALERYRIITSRASAGGIVFVVRETIAFYNDALNRMVHARVNVPYAVVNQFGSPRIKDPGHPWKALRVNLSTEKDGVRATVRKLLFYPQYLAITLTFVNERSGFMTALPYNKSILTDQAGAIYRSLVIKDWGVTDRAFFLGVHLAGNAEMTGTMRFAIPPNADPQTLTFELAPIVRDAGDTAPFALDFQPIDTTISPS
ncbi:MAG: hypothetical protein M3Y21_02820 [Candidatus Eremiobacteraeota bacterium]|nr:hypothetical protein [Candidatus Eremiobacteraeota bacterium]